LLGKTICDHFAPNSSKSSGGFGLDLLLCAPIPFFAKKL